MWVVGAGARRVVVVVVERTCIAVTDATSQLPIVLSNDFASLNMLCARRMPDENAKEGERSGSRCHVDAAMASLVGWLEIG